MKTYWNACYATIARVNNVISYLDVVTDETLRNQYEGEVLFLRSLEYFNLVRLWGPVFIVTSKVPSEVARDMQRSTVDEVYALIEGDLENIVNNELLPGKMADGDLGRADLNSAKALLAKYMLRTTRRVTRNMPVPPDCVRKYSKVNLWEIRNRVVILWLMIRFLILAMR
mgnify:CR=1 FL=1